MDVDSIAVCLIFFPFSVVNVSVSVPELSFAVCFVVSPRALVFSSVRPYLDARPVSHSVFQISFVNGTVLKDQFFDELETFLVGLTFQLVQQLAVEVLEMEFACCYTFCIGVL